VKGRIYYKQWPGLERDWDGKYRDTICEAFTQIPPWREQLTTDDEVELWCKCIAIHMWMRARVLSATDTPFLTVTRQHKMMDRPGEHVHTGYLTPSDLR
jgi:hypothetical protein